MAQDYWRGGWAMPSSMDELPGRKAAASARASYGPLNALADIIGAVMLRNDQRGTMKEIDNFGSEVDNAIATATQPTYDTPTMDMQMGKGGDMEDIQQLQAEQTATVPKKQTFAERKKLIEGMRSDLANRVLRKYGANNMNMALAAIDDTVNNRINDYGRELMNEAYNGLFDGIDIRTQGGQLEALKRYGQYQNLAREVGQEGMSPQEFQNILNSQAMKVSQINQGNKIGFYTSPASGAAMDDGSYMKPVGSAAMGMTPYQQSSLEFQKSEAERDQFNKDRKYQFDLALQQYRMKLDEAQQAMKQAPEQQGWSKAQIDQANMILDAHKKWIEANPGAEPTQDPNYGMVQQIYDAVRGNLGLKQQGGTNPQMVASIQQAIQAGKTKDEILAAMQAKGIDPTPYAEYLK